MAEAKQQTRSSSESDRSVARQSEYYPARDMFSSFAPLSPLAWMRRFSEEMDRAFASAWGLEPERRTWAGWSPAIEVREHDGKLEIAAELPGLSKDDVKVECTSEGIIIEGEKRQEHDETHGGVHRTERSYGHFYRSVPLPQGAEVDKAKAEFKDGVLQVTVPVPGSKQQRRQIPIAV